MIALALLLAASASAAPLAIDAAKRDLANCVVGAAKRLAGTSADAADAVATTALMICSPQQDALASETKRYFSGLAVSAGREPDDMAAAETATKVISGLKQQAKDTAVTAVVLVRSSPATSR